MADVINLVQSRTGLKANGSNQELILAYIEKNASETLVEKIKASGKTLGQCMNYITGEARKRAVSGCAMIEDKEVYGWAMHFFEEDSITAAEPKAPAAKIVAPAKVEKKEPVKKEPAEMKPLDGQMNIFDFLGAPT